MATTRLALDSNGLAAQRQLFALVPDEYYDFSSNTFAKDGRYTITTWAEEEEGNQISPGNSLTFGIQEQLAHAWDVRTNLRGFARPPVDDDALDGLSAGTNIFVCQVTNVFAVNLSYSKGDKAVVVQMTILEEDRV